MRFLSANGFLPVCDCKSTQILQYGKNIFLNPNSNPQIYMEFGDSIRQIYIQFSDLQLKIVHFSMLILLV